MASSRNDLLQRALVLVPTQRALAERLGLTKSRMSRIARGGTPSVTTCLWLADTLGERPSAVLRAFGYADEADILDRAHPPSGKAPAGDVAMLRDAARLTPKQRGVVRELVALLAPPPRGRTKR